MINTKLFLLLGTSLYFLPQSVVAQCVAPQDCETLGYTETSCNSGKGVKCPFGNKWACLGLNEEECLNLTCDKLGFKYTCTGTGYAGGSGQICNGKYSQCNCSAGYEWKNGICQIQDGAHGNLYYCNNKVIAVKTSSMSFYITLNDLGAMNWNQAVNVCSTAFCANARGSLPSKSQFETIYANKANLENLFTTYGGTKFSGNYYWTSTYHSHDVSGDFYYMYTLSGGYDAGCWIGNAQPVRAILTSW